MNQQQNQPVTMETPQVQLRKVSIYMRVARSPELDAAKNRMLTPQEVKKRRLKEAKIAWSMSGRIVPIQKSFFPNRGKARWIWVS